MRSPLHPVARLAALAILATAAWSCRPHHADETTKPVMLTASVSPATFTVPTPLTEFRGVWVAAVENINWPSKPGLTTEQQQAELRALLDRSVEGHFNAVLLQVRPCADALYESKLEPWSYYLTGEVGKAPSPYYDPLEYAVKEAHARGLELHAWINPFRVKQAGSKVELNDPKSLASTHPDWVRTYGKLQWIDPGEPAGREQSLAVVNDIVRRYDVDGVHIDDYFYPYKQQDPVTKKNIDFPDDATFAKYANGKSRNDFRRANIDEFVQKMYEQTKAAKPWVKVGISPFGIWRPGYPAQIKGFDSYDEIYGDSLKWLREGWADYFTPQLYWPVAQTPQSWPVLMSWWQSENAKGRHLWPGLYSTKTDVNGPEEAAPWAPTEVEYQIKLSRGLTPPSLPLASTPVPYAAPRSAPTPKPTTYPAYPGTIHFSASFLGTGKDAAPDNDAAHPLFPHLLKTVYAEPAMVPPSPWLMTPFSIVHPSLSDVKVTVTQATGNASPVLALDWTPRPGNTVLPARYLLQYTTPNTTASPSTTRPATQPKPVWHQLNAITTSAELPPFPAGTRRVDIALTAIDLYGGTLAPLTFSVELK